MTRSTYLISGVWAVALWGGCNDLGECTDPAQGRVPVRVGTEVMYAGQAIIVQSCAAGSCHTERTTRENRRGAPAGLDFDISPMAAEPDADGGIAQISAEDLQSLRKHQRKVFDERHSIWEQVEKDLMPPDGLGQPYRETSLGTLINVSSGGCPEKGQLAPITDQQTRELLRNWLACGSPIVETNVKDLDKPVGGIIGDQFPACPPPRDPTFDNVYNVIISVSCVAGCHEPSGGGGAEDFDLSSPDVAYASMMGANGMGMVPSGCANNENFMIVPRQPGESYFYAKVGGEGGRVCKSFMPLGSEGLPAAELDLVRRWIEAGAPAPGVAAGDAGADSNEGMDGGT